MTPRPDSPAPGEPRGPHGAAAIVGIEWTAWPFILLALGDLVLRVSRGELPVPLLSLATVEYVLATVPTMVVILLPAALLIRHPDAPWRLRTLLSGLILMASVEALELLAEPLQAVFEQLTPADPDMAYLVPLAAAYDGLVTLVGSSGLLCLGLGLSAARLYEDRRRVPTAGILLVVGVIVAVIRTVTAIRVDLGGAAMTPGLTVYFASFVVLGTLTVLAWTYVTTTAAAGALAGEDPAMGWRLAAAGGLLILIAIAVFTIGGFLESSDETLLAVGGWVRNGLFAIGHVALLGAFLVGLPAVEEEP